MKYVLATVITLSLSAGQALWASAVRSLSLDKTGSAFLLLVAMMKTVNFWLGALFYGLSVVLYLILLSKVKFFSVQITMTALAIVFSVVISAFIFKETITVWNGVGIMLVLVGSVFVIR